MKPDVICVYVAHKDRTDGKQLIFRYFAPLFEGDDVEEGIKDAVQRATASLSPWEIYDVEVYTTTPRRFNVRHGIEERK